MTTYLMIAPGLIGLLALATAVLLVLIKADVKPTKMAAALPKQWRPYDYRTDRWIGR